MEKTNNIEEKYNQALRNSAILLEIVKTLTHESKILTNCLSGIFEEFSDKDVFSFDQLKKIDEVISEIGKSQKATMALMDLVSFDKMENTDDTAAN